MSDDVIRVHGPAAEVARCRWNPRFRSSDAVFQSSSTAESSGAAPKDSSVTAVGNGGANTNSCVRAVMSPQYWNSRMSVLITASTGLVV